jgi:sulfatase-like protein
VRERAEPLAAFAARNGIHLAVLSALAIAQPIFDILGRNPTFFAVRGSSSTEIVLFGIVLTLVPPAVLTLVTVAAAAVSRRVGWGLQLVFVGSFVGLVALTVLTKADALRGAAAVAGAAAVGALGALAYARVSTARTFLTVLAPVPLLFLALFLLHSPVHKLVFVHTPEVRAAALSSRTPVVLIVFDEFSSVGLMNKRQEIDAVRYPHFADLARQSTWYRSATTRGWVTELAVPSIMTGLPPQPGKLPVYAEYPNNVFTLLGGTYRVRAIETLTRLCPPKICRATQQRAAHVASPEFGPLASDVGIVYLHLVLPKPYADRVPAVDESWGDFGKSEQTEAVLGGPPELPACGRNVCNFLDLIEPARQPTFYFLHVLLPHTPYLYLPSGRQYTVDPRLLRGLHGGQWGAEAWPVLQGYERYLVQIGYTDRALGVITKRLREAGVYDRALVIATADHGVSFHPNGRRRLPLGDNLDDIAFVPLFVKLPHQRRGRLNDSFARTIDILPTIAKVLGVSVPWRTEGKSLVGRRLPADGVVSVITNTRIANLDLATLRARRVRSLARQQAAFGSGSWARLYKVGPHRELVGREVATLSVRPSAATGITLDGESLLQSVDPGSALLPSFIEGKLIGKFPARQDVAVAVNGTIEAVTKTFRQAGETRFSALVPESALQAGRNTVDVFGIRGSGTSLVLEQFRSEELSLTLARSDGRDVIRSSTGKTLRVVSGALKGTIRVERTAVGYRFSGTASVTRPRARADLIIVFVDGRAAYRGRAGDLRPQAVLGQPDLGKYGFVFDLPKGLLPAPGGEHSVRIFVTHRLVASELAPGGAFPWSR